MSMSSSRSSKVSAAASSRKVTFFVPGDGIDREVISTDICRYLGNDATARPGEYTDTKTGETTRGFYITAYRALTTEQLADIKADSLRWQAEKKQPPTSSNRQPSGGISPRAADAVGRRSDLEADDYRQSATRKQQQQWDQPPPPPEPYPGQSRRTPTSSARGGGYEQPPPLGRQPPPPVNPYQNQAPEYTYYDAEPAAQRNGPSYPPSSGPPSRSQPGGYSYPAVAPPPSYPYSNGQALPNGSGMPPPFQPRDVSPQQVQYVAQPAGSRDEEMYDVDDDNYRRPEMSSSYRTSSAREPEPPRREDRSDRHRDSRRRH